LNSFAKPLKVFILAGQSNMEGHAAISTFDYIGKDPLTAPILKEMRNPDGTPRVCDNPLFPFPDRLSSVFSALGEKANS